MKESSTSRAVSAASSSKTIQYKTEVKQQQMNTLQHKRIQGVSKRWNSIYHMVEKLLEQRSPVTATLSDPEVTPRGKYYFDMKPDQWVLLEDPVQRLQPFG